MMKRLFFVFLSIMIVFGCGPQYLEVETLAGSVPPATSSPQNDVNKGLGNAYIAKVVEVAEVADVTPVSDLAQTADFEKSYDVMQRPRIAVLFNRSFDDHITEWESSRRVAFSSDENMKAAFVDDSGQTSKAYAPAGNFSQENVGKAKASVNNSGWTAVQHKVNNVDPRQLSWKFQDGFIEPWLDAGVNLIDRATIVRLTAAKHQNTDGLNTKTVETDALKGYADIFVEVLVDDFFENKGFYRFRVTAKDIDTGSLLANTVMEYPNGSMQANHSQQYEATANGFQPASNAPVFTDAFEAGKILATNVMNDMSRRM